MQRINADVQQIIVAENEPDGFLKAAVHFHFFQSGKTPHAIVNVCHVVAGLQRAQLPECHGFGLGKPFAGLVAVKPVENLVVGVAGYFDILIYETRAQGRRQQLEFDERVYFLKNRGQSFLLPYRVSGNHVHVAMREVVLQVGSQQMEVLIKGWLRGRWIFHFLGILEVKPLAKLNHRVPLEFLQEIAPRIKQFIGLRDDFEFGGLVGLFGLVKTVLDCFKRQFNVFCPDKGIGWQKFQEGFP